MTELSIDPTLPRQRFRQTLDGVAYLVTLAYVGRTDGYVMSLHLADETPVVEGVRVTANWPLFRGRTGSYFPRGQLICVGDADEGPRFGELGTSALGSPCRILYLAEGEE